MFDQAAVAESPWEGASGHYRVVRSSVVRDRDLAAAGRDCLESQGYRSLRLLSCACHDGVLVLSGRVSSFYEKQLAQEAVKRLIGIRQVVNSVRVNA